METFGDVLMTTHPEFRFGKVVKHHFETVSKFIQQVVQMPALPMKDLTSNEIEAANRAEATALLIKTGYRVFSPEAACYGEDMILRTPSGELRSVQVKGRATVDLNRYGKKALWMLFPGGRSNSETGRNWFLVPHDLFYEWVKEKHGHTPKWSDPRNFTKQLSAFLHDFAITAPTNRRNSAKYYESINAIDNLSLRSHRRQSRVQDTFDRTKTR
jgi:hypothetical protein